MAQAQLNAEKSTAVTVENEEEDEFGPQSIKKLEVSHLFSVFNLIYFFLVARFPNIIHPSFKWYIRSMELQLVT